MLKPGLKAAPAAFMPGQRKPRPAPRIQINPQFVANSVAVLDSRGKRYSWQPMSGSLPAGSIRLDSSTGTFRAVGYTLSHYADQRFNLYLVVAVLNRALSPNPFVYTYRQVASGVRGLPMLAPVQILTPKKTVAKRTGVGDAASDSQAIGSTITAGDAYLAANEYDNAVSAYQAAGQAAVTISHRYNLTMPPGFGGGGSGDWNASLQSFPSSGNGASEALSAQSLANNIYSALQSAIQSGGGGGGGGGGTAPAPGGGGGTSQATELLVETASSLLGYFQQNGVKQGYIQQAYTFQQAWNATGASPLTLDGKYGKDTQAALQAVMTAYGNGGQAPQSAYSNVVPAPVPAPPAVPGGGGAVVPVPGGGGGLLAGVPTWALWAIGLATAGGVALVGASAWKKHGGKVMGHARRAAGHLRRASSRARGHVRRLSSRLRARHA